MLVMTEVVAMMATAVTAAVMFERSCGDAFFFGGGALIAVFSIVQYRLFLLFFPSALTSGPGRVERYGFCWRCPMRGSKVHRVIRFWLRVLK